MKIIHTALITLLLCSGMVGCDWFRTPPPVLNAPMDTEGKSFLGTYFNQPGCQPATADNPLGLHYGIDFVLPTGTTIRAAAPGNITWIEDLSTHIVVHQSVSGGYSVMYNFEPALSIVVTEGQSLATGDAVGVMGESTTPIGYLGSDPEIPDPITSGYGMLDFRLVDTAHAHTCPVPYASSQFKSLLEEWFARNFTATADRPGPCTCHYHFPP
jgi:hypothetical protein